MMQMTVSVDKDMKAITVTVFHIFKKPEEFAKQKRGRYTNHSHQFSRDKNHMSEMKKIYEMRLIIDQILQKKKTNKFEDMAVETTENDTQRKKTEKNRTSVISGATSNGQAYM